ncbi:cytochrome b/b6 domain-containing protein [Streptomyces kunmingensis]|uniref:Cytochrome b/b6 domain-containing protein n=1 Tax=Streptomyces kunmingensis TaxID=68225 RepID=A0ABU6CJ40_9ACTN|nr:ferric reductase-like transmembrane domain-containing protein [Streptomyces kunmingensis]MEB3964474.1 cytochrome b/b6 domain-containing protein [Streptomyces kunmingensis]
MLSAAVLLLIPVVVVTGSDAFRAALDFTTGVLSLVSLTASVVWGLVASDRLFLTSRQRLLSQGVHRATAVASLGFLLLHGSVKVALAHVTLIGALIPFGMGVTGSSGLIGIGVLAGLLMVTTGITGALRSSMASPAGLAARWRATHMLAYPAWCLALMHGLYAGRAPKTYVVVLYCLCLIAVAGAVGLRAAPRPVKVKVAARIFAFLDPGPRRARDIDRGTPRDVAAGAPRDVAEQPLPATEAPARPSPAPAGVGFAAAYRAVSATPRGEAPLYTEPRQTTYVEPTYVQPAPVEPTYAEHSYGDPSEPAPTHRWPAPSPPPPAEAPQSAYDPRYDTPYGGVPSYDTAYGSGGPYEERYGGQYEANESPTEPLPGPFQAPSSGEPWTTPYGGTQ